MTRKDRTAANRLNALQSASPRANVSLFAVRRMFSGIDSQELHCTISEYCRTLVFEFPRIDFRPAGDEPHHEIDGYKFKAKYVATPSKRQTGFEWSNENTCWLRWPGRNEAHITLGGPAPSGQWLGKPLAPYKRIHCVDDLVAGRLLGDMPCR